MLNKKVLLLLLFFLLIPSTYAHQPRLVMDVNTTEENSIIIKNPEVSQAFYGQLEGNPDYYKIDSDKPFKLYLNILVPNIPVENERRFSVKVTDSNKKQVMFLDGSKNEWKEFYEEFGGDSYLEGPEARLNVSAGTYLIKVYNSDNKGKYSLAVGEIESFPIDETLKTMLLLPVLKERFFNKPAYTGFLNLIGLFIFIPIIIVIILAVVFYKLLKRFRRSN